MLDSTRIERAIAIVAESRRSHETWIAWYKQQPSEEAKHADTCGDVPWHRQCIEGYDLVLDVLRQTMQTARESLKPIAQEQASDGEPAKSRSVLRREAAQRGEEPPEFSSGREGDPVKAYMQTDEYKQLTQKAMPQRRVDREASNE